MRFLILAAGLAALAVPSAALAHPHPDRYGQSRYGHGSETARELRECRRELRRADSRREYQRERRECRRELREARRDDARRSGYRYGYRDRSYRGGRW